MFTAAWRAFKGVGATANGAAPDFGASFALPVNSALCIPYRGGGVGWRRCLRLLPGGTRRARACHCRIYLPHTGPNRRVNGEEYLAYQAGRYARRGVCVREQQANFLAACACAHLCTSLLLAHYNARCARAAAAFWQRRERATAQYIDNVLTYLFIYREHAGVLPLWQRARRARPPLLLT